MSCSQLIAQLISAGDLSSARAVALQHSLERPAPPSPFTSALPAAGLNKERSSECVESWRDQVSRLLEREGALSLISSAHAIHNGRPRYSELAPAHQCSDLELYDLVGMCCSRLQSARPSHCPRSINACCEVGNGPVAALHLPALREPSLTLRLPSSGRLLSIEQDGWLRPFDVATVQLPPSPSAPVCGTGGDPPAYALNLPVHADAGALASGLSPHDVARLPPRRLALVLSRSRLRAREWLRAVVVERLHGRWHRWCGRWRGRKRRRARRQPYD